MAHGFCPSFINSTTGDPSSFHVDTEWFSKQDLSLFIESLETISRLERKKHERQKKRRERKRPVLDFIQKICALTLDDLEEPLIKYSDKCCLLRSTTKTATTEEHKINEFVAEDVPQEEEEEEEEKVEADEPLIKMEKMEFVNVDDIQHQLISNHNNNNILSTLECHDMVGAKVSPTQNYDEETYFSAPGSELNSPRNSKTFDIAEPNNAYRQRSDDHGNRSDSEESGVFPGPAEERVLANEMHHHHHYLNESITSTITTRSLFGKKASKRHRRSMRSRIMGLVLKHGYLSWRHRSGEREQKLKRKKEKKLRRMEEKFLKMEEERKQRHDRLIDDLLKRSMTSLATKSTGRKSVGAEDNFLNKALRYMTL